jgi:hypothetical protein
MPTERNNNGVFLDGEHRGFSIPWAGWQINNRIALLPLGNSLGLIP